MIPDYGKPLLSPWASDEILTGKHGRLQVRPVPDANTFGLFYLSSKPESTWAVLTCHPNGHSCLELGKRILTAWEGKDSARAVAQYSFIERCGGLVRNLETILNVIHGQY